MSSPKKLIAVGDRGCGKTSLLTAFSKGNSSHVFTVFENCTSSVKVESKTIELCLFNTCGQENFDSVRILQYSATQVVLICFSVIWPASFRSVIDKWWPEVRFYCPGVPIVLVGNKSDLRNDPEALAELSNRLQRPVSQEEAKNLAKEIGAVDYIECSSKTKHNVNEVFVIAAKATLNNNLIIKRCLTCILCQSCDARRACGILCNSCNVRNVTNVCNTCAVM